MLKLVTITVSALYLLKYISLILPEPNAFLMNMFFSFTPFPRD